MATAIVSNICPVCDQEINVNGFAYHLCDGDYTITLNGHFHAVRDNAVQARTYIYSISRRHEAAGIEVEIMQDGDPNEDYYAGGVVSDYELEQERIELAAAAADVAAQERDYASAVARLAGLADEQAAHDDQVREADQLPLPLFYVSLDLDTAA